MVNKKTETNESEVAVDTPVAPVAAPEAATATVDAPVSADTVVEAPVAADAVVETLEDSRERHAASVIREHLYLSGASGLIPVPFLDSAALVAVNLRLLRDLSRVYGVEFRSEIGKEAIGTLLASVAPPMLAGGLLCSSLGRAALRTVPVIGTAVGLVVLPAFHAAFTYALGSAFRRHFASGGTFLTFDAEAAKTYFRDKYESFRRRKAPEAEVPAEAPVAA